MLQRKNLVAELQQRSRETFTAESVITQDVATDGWIDKRMNERITAESALRQTE